MKKKTEITETPRHRALMNNFNKQQLAEMYCESSDNHEKTKKMLAVAYLSVVNCDNLQSKNNELRLTISKQVTTLENADNEISFLRKLVADTLKEAVKK